MENVPLAPENPISLGANGSQVQGPDNKSIAALYLAGVMLQLT